MIIEPNFFAVAELDRKRGMSEAASWSRTSWGRQAAYGGGEELLLVWGESVRRQAHSVRATRRRTCRGRVGGDNATTSGRAEGDDLGIGPGGGLAAAVNTSCAWLLRSWFGDPHVFVRLEEGIGVQPRCAPVYVGCACIAAFSVDALSPSRPLNELSVGIARRIAWRSVSQAASVG